MKKPTRYQSKAQFRTLLPTIENRRSGFKERESEIPRGFIHQLKLRLKQWELEQQYPNLKKEIA